MLTRKFLTIYGIVGVAAMIVMFILVWFKLVPQEYYLPLFLIAFVIWVSRLVLRMVLARREKEEAAPSDEHSHP
ncbi:MAG: hypothetical protein AAB393_18180 [Bacteroidota bacterium]